MAKVFDSMLTSTTYRDGSKNYFIKPEDIFEFFSKSENIYIPDYQRPYSWESVHIKALLDDINILEEGRSWFLGPIFTALPADSNSLQLLDGQQRITSLQLILREIYLFEFYFDDSYHLNTVQNSEYNKYRAHKSDILTCLLKNEGGKKEPRFSTESTAKDFFKNFIYSISSINNLSDYTQVNDNFKEDATSHQKNGSRTAITLLERKNDIVQYFNKNFFSLSDTEVIYGALNKFTENILYKLWIIKIPLLKTTYSTNIFESINNRGKGLSLIDKLKFKTLTKFDSDIDEEDISHINKQWKKIYKLIDESVKGNDPSEKARFFKKEDDFFSVFFNSIDGSDNSQEEHKLLKFEENYLVSKEQINKFLEQVINVLEFLKLIYSPSESHEFIQSVMDLVPSRKNETSKKEAKNKAMALLRMTRNMISASDNSRYLIFKLIIKNGLEYSRIANILTTSLWNINKIVFFDEIWQNDKSNEIRPRYLKYIQKDLNFLNIEHFFYTSDQSNNEEEENNKWYRRHRIQEVNPINFIINNNNDSTRYAIWFITFLVNYRALNFANDTAFIDIDVEHIRPEKWKTFNYEIKCTTEELQETFNDVILTNEFGDSLKKMQKDLSNKFIALEDFDLKDQNSAPKSSIVEFIGNKMVLDQSKNRSLTNKAYVDKFKAYQTLAQKFMIPTFTFGKVGMSNFKEAFGMKEILIRSLLFVDIVHQNYELSYDEIIDLVDV